MLFYLKHKVYSVCTLHSEFGMKRFVDLLSVHSVQTVRGVFSPSRVLF